MKKCNKVYATVVFVVAVVVCYLVTQRSFDASAIIIPLSRFIEVLIPILGIGALVKFIACGHQSGCCCCKDQNDNACGK
ncbi:MAG: hypothetical protein K0S08_214 [Gammaproteobacteria bacterium]|nr:hypothetical protein [Gammaproteobacteria bacterium]